MPEQPSIRLSNWELFSLILGVFFVWNYFLIIDDAFIYCRYIDNFLFGKIGLVYNKGEFVEGYTSPLWLLSVTMFRALGLDYLTIFQLLSVFCFFIFWRLGVHCNQQLLSHDKIESSLNFPLIALSTNYAVTSFFSSGLESPLMQISAAVYCAFALSPEKRLLRSVCALLPLVRPEFVVLVPLVFFWAYLRTKKIPYDFIFVLLITCGGWLLFRIYYYADFFPNTFYAKNTTWIESGLLFIWHIVRAYRVQWIAGTFLILYLYLFRTCKKKDTFSAARIFMIASAILILLCVIKVGGGPRHYRYAAFPFCLLYLSAGGLLEVFLARMKLSVRWTYPVIFTSTTLLSVFVWYPHYLSKAPIFNPVISEPVDGFSDMRWLRSPSADHQKRVLLEEYTPEKVRDVLRDISSSDYHQNLVTYGCRMAYQQIDFKVLHSFGLTDVYLARIKTDFNRPGHPKLVSTAAELANVYDRLGVFGSQEGVFLKSVNEKVAPLWVQHNVDYLSLLEQKVHNKHKFVQNFFLALKTARKFER